MVSAIQGTAMPNELTPDNAYKAIKQLMRERDAKILADLQLLNFKLDERFHDY